MLELWPRGRSQPRRALSQALRDSSRRRAASLRRVPEASRSTSLIRSPRRPAPGTEERCSGTACTSRAAPTRARRPYSVMIRGEEIIAGSNQRFRVLAVVPIENEDSRFVGLLQVDAA